MVSGFRRSLSLPGPHPKSPPSPSSPGPKGQSGEEKSHHVRSASLPCPSHPLVSHLEEEIRALRAWHSQPEPGSAWLSCGLVHLDVLQNSMADLLKLSHSQDSLRRDSAWAERLLDDFLRLADAFSAFRSIIMDSKEHCSEARIAIRRGDEARVASCARSLKSAEKGLSKLASALQTVIRSPTVLRTASDARESELVGIMWEATTERSMASAALLLRVATDMSAVSTALSSSFVSRDSWVRRLSAVKNKGANDQEEWKKATWKRMEELEECMSTVESGSERVFRTLVNTRVSLLNILTPLL